MNFCLSSSRRLSIAILSVSLAGSATLCAPMAYAQTASAATVTGFVLDPDQAAIPGATVTLTPAKGQALVTTSGSDGAYTFRNVPAGTYSVTVTMQGFASFVRQGVRVGTATVNLNTAMTVQAESTEINVTTQNTQVSTDPDSNGSSVVIKDKDLEALSDDPDELSSELSALAGPSAGPNGGQIYVDGFTGGTLPPKSSIREIRVNQNPFSAQFDKQGFGRVEVFTKPGTDKYHGNFSIQGNDKAFNTSSPFLGSTNQQPDYHRIFFIGSLTGPATKTSSYSIAGSYRDIEDNSIFAGYAVTSSPSSSVLCQPGDLTCTLNVYPDASRATFHPQKRWDLTPRYDVALGEKNTLTIRYQFEHNDQTNAGLGATSLNTTAYNSGVHEHQLTISDTQIISSKLINETRLQLVRQITSQSPLNTTPTLTVTGYFTGGGSSAGTQNSTNDHLELQNYTSIALQKNFIRAGVRLRVYREALFSNAGSNGTFTYGPTYNCTTAPCTALTSDYNYVHGQPFQYRVTTINNPRAEQSLADVGFYAEDDWKIKPNMTLSYGARLESQSAINSKADIAPRVALSYGVPSKKGNPGTVIRAGWGIFYDRFDLSDVIQTQRQNGINQVTNIYGASRNADGSVAAITTGCGPTNTTACGTGTLGSQTIYQLGANLRSSYNMQTALGVDQQVGKRSTVSFNYLNTIGDHMYMSRSIPTAAGNYVYQYQSGGVYRQNQIIVNVRTQLSPRFSMFGFYTYSNAKANTNGPDAFPTDSLNPRTDYGRALFNATNRVFLFGNWNAPYGINLSPFFSVNSGSPYNITTGTDVNGDTVINDRAGFANGVSGNCKTATDFISTGITSANRVPQGYCTGPSNVQGNLRIVKVFGFGAKTGAAARGGRNGQNGQNGQNGPGGGMPPGGGGPRGGGGGGGRGPGGPGGFGGGASSGHKYTLSVGAQIQNLFNYVPYSTPSGSLSSYSPDPSKNLFGKSTSLSSMGPGGSSAAVRTVTLQMSFNF
ncbi:Carboxypeptidase regulatory-like domain-containing protein [Terriglobus roseus]|uniref:Carboxypeptidase regulatory-like domain-containing protein n=2 Tax=Terriglobus roseus TaxID=392734 RepID=A0A1G7LSV1_9BACT|nr:Carboxypeptidase regulatory-like domain-containing protein [Terriglobus roseus]